VDCGESVSLQRWCRLIDGRLGALDLKAKVHQDHFQKAMDDWLDVLYGGKEKMRRENAMRRDYGNLNFDTRASKKLSTPLSNRYIACGVGNDPLFSARIVMEVRLCVKSEYQPN
jgi:hypothetical protein